MSIDFQLLTLDISQHAQSWITVCAFTPRHALFYIEWNYSKEITNVQLFWFLDWYQK